MRIASPGRLTRAGITLMVGLGMLTGFAVFAASSPNSDHRTSSTTVNRANKGDLLPARSATQQPSRAPAATKTDRPPFGCDAPFSRIVEPAQTLLHYRCAA
jgi:hypothetical protein